MNLNQIIQQEMGTVRDQMDALIDAATRRILVQAAQTMIGGPLAGASAPPFDTEADEPPRTTGDTKSLSHDDLKEAIRDHLTANPWTRGSDLAKDRFGLNNLQEDKRISYILGRMKTAGEVVSKGERQMTIWALKGAGPVKKKGKGPKGNPNARPAEMKESAAKRADLIVAWLKGRKGWTKTPELCDKFAGGTVTRGAISLQLRRLADNGRLQAKRVDTGGKNPAVFYRAK